MRTAAPASWTAIQDITLADFTSAEIEGIAYGLNNKVGNTR